MSAHDLAAWPSRDSGGKVGRASEIGPKCANFQHWLSPAPYLPAITQLLCIFVIMVIEHVGDEEEFPPYTNAAPFFPIGEEENGWG